MQAKLLEIGAQTGEKTAALQRVINYLTEAQAALGHPPQIPEQREQATAVDMISVMNDLSAARAEAGTLRAQLEQQQADAETQLQEMKAALSETERQMARSMEDLGQRATQAEARERQLKSETSQSAVQIQMLKDQVGSLQQQIQTIQSESSAVADDLKRRLVEAIDELRRFQADLEMAQGQLREGDQLGRDVAFEPTRRRFLALAEIIDDLRRAESSEPAMEAYNRGLRHIRERFYTYFGNSSGYRWLRFSPARQNSITMPGNGLSV
jgi:chromosome segregation ATPase